MTGLLARTYAELQVYLDLQPCACGSTALASKERQLAAGDLRHVELRGRCRDCRRKRVFDFVLPAVLPMLPVGRFSALDRPSELIGPAEWRGAAAFFTDPYQDPGASADLTDEQDRDRALAFAAAAGALEEALLFGPDAELEAARDAYRAQAGSFDGDEWPALFIKREARGSREARLWVELRRCNSGAARFDATEELSPPAPDRPAGTLSILGDCPLCGRRREYVFAVPYRPARTPSGPLGYAMHFEGDGPSALLDPAQFLVNAARYARLADRAGVENARDLADPLRWEAVYELYAAAAAGLEEALLFVPPGADRVPAAKVTTALGRTLLRTDPDALRRDRLEAGFAERSRAFDAFAAFHPEPRP